MQVIYFVQYASSFLRAFGGLDQFPELRIFLKGLILAHLDTGPEQKIFERMAAQDTVYQDTERMAFEINPIITDSEAVKNVAVALKFAEIFQFTADDMLGQSAKIPEDLKLQFLGHFSQFGGAGGSKNNLERIHCFGSHILVAGFGQINRNVELWLK